MQYYEVWVSSPRFHGNTPLTYQYGGALETGAVVVVNLNKRTALGIIAKKVKKPSFKTSLIIEQLGEKTLPAETMQLMEWIKEYYPGPSGLIVQLFLPTGLLQKARIAQTRDKPSLVKSLPPLTLDQKKALDSIGSSNKNQPILLHGNTGTGKTRIYVELAKQQIENGKSVLILTPEIGLTPQLSKSFELTFPGKVLNIHSNLTTAKRRDVWQQILGSTEPVIIIGPRSAIFSPISKLGLIVMDEAHDNAYKQDQVPHYLASRVAAQLAKIHAARLVLGSATPSVSDYYAFSAKKLPIVRMTSPAVKTVDSGATIRVVNLADKSLFGRSSWISDELIEEIEKHVERGEQSMLFLNRRGTARIILCQDCGWQLLCPRCDLPLTYHGDSHQARCHTCGYTTNAPTSCPICKGSEIVFKSIGTKLIASEVQRLLPKARVKRFDSDNLKADKLDANYDSVKDGNVDILVGTQVLTKGLDLPKLGLVGIIVADTGLYIPDYTSDENTYQMLSQVIGRVGRGHVAGTVVLQTYNPSSPLIKAAVNGKYDKFYEQQISERRQFIFPPFCYLLKLSCTRSSQASAQKTCQKLIEQLDKLGLPISVIGPSPAFHEKQSGKYTWQMVIKAKSRGILTNLIKDLPSGWFYDIDPTNLL